MRQSRNQTGNLFKKLDSPDPDPSYVDCLENDSFDKRFDKILDFNWLITILKINNK